MQGCWFSTIPKQDSYVPPQRPFLYKLTIHNLTHRVLAYHAIEVRNRNTLLMHLFQRQLGQVCYINILQQQINCQQVWKWRQNHLPTLRVDRCCVILPLGYIFIISKRFLPALFDFPQCTIGVYSLSTYSPIIMYIHITLSITLSGRRWLHIHKSANNILNTSNNKSMAIPVLV
jgi:hypothetical protein